MGRLIDAETLKQELYQQWFMDILLTQNSGKDMFYALAQKIDEIPTAYDPDKVVEQLDKASDYYEFDEQGMEHVQMLRLVDAIEIVKGGGVNGD